MVYFCPVDWRWIKQRPQFLAEELSRFYGIHVIYPFSKNRKGLQKIDKDHVKKTPYLTLPTLGGRLKIAAKINKHLIRMQTGLTIGFFKPDLLWITLPEQSHCIPEDYQGYVIYDCMDDYVAFSENSVRQDEIRRQEEELVHRADLVFVTSTSLKNKLCERYCLDGDRIVILRNGYSAKWEPKNERSMSGKRLRIGYFGTISHWFDFKLLENSLKACKNVEYHLYGPIAGGVQIPSNERVIYHGVVEHDAIRYCADDLDALMMPFELNELILSVDPVKLYEYICLNKNILCVRYPEIERFEPFAMFYNGQEEYEAKLRLLCEDNTLRYSREAAQEFLKENSWSRRAETACQIIENSLSGEN